jgi:hypothetical protein
MMKKIKDNPLAAVLLGSFLAWMAWISLASYQAINIDSVNHVLHRRISNTKQELTEERNGQVLDLKKQIYDLQEQNRELRGIVLEFIAKGCPEVRQQGLF